jgi:hypothetical protein
MSTMIRRAAWALCFVGGGAGNASAAAAIVSGYDLYTACSSQDNTQTIMCLTHLNAAVLMLTRLQKALPALHVICPANNSSFTVGQARLVLNKYASEHPEELNYPAPDLIIAALGSAFPCR